MPIIKREDFGTDRAPAWAKVTGGINAMGCSTRDESGSVELHFHDCEEFWFVLDGKAKVATDGKEYIVEKGDIVCTHMGEEHAIYEFKKGMSNAKNVATSCQLISGVASLTAAIARHFPMRWMVSESYASSETEIWPKSTLMTPATPSRSSLQK